MPVIMYERLDVSLDETINGKEMQEIQKASSLKMLDAN